MRDDCKMSFRKLKRISIHGNSPKNLILRQQFAINMVQQSLAGKVLLCIDETWLGMSDFRKMKWRVKGSTNSVPSIQLVPRISMIVGVDTLGNIYLSLTQSNSNSQIMDIFFRYLDQRLEKERKKWKNNTIIILDNAPYHNSSYTLKTFESLKLPIMFTGPHSYDGSPCELFFAQFKQADINPRHLPMGKK